MEIINLEDRMNENKGRLSSDFETYVLEQGQIESFEEYCIGQFQNAMVDFEREMETDTSF